MGGAGARVVVVVERDRDLVFLRLMMMIDMIHRWRTENGFPQVWRMSRAAPAKPT